MPSLKIRSAVVIIVNEMFWDFEVLFLSLCSVSFTQARAVTEECRRDPRRPPPPLERHRDTARVVLGSFFQHTLQSPGMKTLQFP